MQNKDCDTCNIINHYHHFRPVLVFEGIIVGALSSLVAVLYRFLLEKAFKLCHVFINMSKSNLGVMLLWFSLLIIFSIIVGAMIKRIPIISGSGIPQVEGALSGKLKMDWLKILIGKFTTGILCIGSGLSLGREGPSIQLGAAVGKGFSSIFKRMKIEEKYLITSGASAGLAAAFNAPLAGVMFSLEEVHKSFSPLILLSATSAAVTSDFVSKLFFGMNPVFGFSQIDPLPAKDYFILILLGLMLGLTGALFNSTLLKTQDLYKAQKWLPLNLRPLVPFLTAGVLGFILPQVLGGGHEIVISLTKENYGLSFLFILLAAKFLFTVLCYGSGSPGGIFLPLLSIGAIIGCIFGVASANYLGLDMKYINNFIILAMAGYFTAVVRAPLTGSILITEMTGSFSHLLSLTLVSIIAYITAEALNSKPVYESLLERLLEGNNDIETQADNKNKSMIEIPVSSDSILSGRRIRDIKWPENCLLVGIRRGGAEIIPRGKTVIMAGDYLLALSDEKDMPAVENSLKKMAEKPIIG